MIRKAAIFLLSVTLLFAVASCSRDDSTGSHDKTAPEVEIKTPWDGTKRFGDVAVTVEATDEYGVTRVDLYINGAKVASDSDYPYEFDWDMSTLAVGSENTLYAKAVDAKGNASKSETVIVTHEETAAPVATLTGPADNSSFQQGTAITFTGSGADAEDGALGDDDISWSSNLQGELGTGLSMPYRGLVIGTHVITMTATDSNGLTDSKTTNVTVTENSLDYATVEEGTYRISAPVFNGASIKLSRAFHIYKTELNIKEFLQLMEIVEGPMGGKKKGWLYWASERNDELYDISKASGLYPNGRIYETNYTYTSKGGYEGDGEVEYTYGDYPACFFNILEAVSVINAMSERDGLEQAVFYTDKDGIVTTETKKAKGLFIDVTKNGWRFPTESEWEVAARGGFVDMKFPWGDIGPGSLCNSMSDQIPPNPVDFYNGRGIVPVTSYEPNRYGLYNMVGNVAELTGDLFIGTPPSGVERYDRWDIEGVTRFLAKGGAWYQFGANMQIGMRNITLPMNTKDKDAMGSGIGLRPVRNAD